MIVFVLAAVLSLVNLFSELYSSKIERIHSGFISFSAGLFITFIFMEIFPETLKGLDFLGHNLFVLILLGFVVFHLGEKFVYQHIKHKKLMLKDLAFIHIGGFFIYHFVIGIMLFLSFSTGITSLGLFAFALLLTHIIASSVSLTHIDEFVGMNKPVMILLASAPLAGTVFASLLKPSPEIYYSLFAFVLGAVFYIVTRDMLPEEKEGNSKLFLAGFVLSLAAILMMRGF